jgi:hypothetical protein
MKMRKLFAAAIILAAAGSAAAQQPPPPGGYNYYNPQTGTSINYNPYTRMYMQESISSGSIFRQLPPERENVPLRRRIDPDLLKRDRQDETIICRRGRCIVVEEED